MHYLDIPAPRDIETAFRAATRGRAEAVLMMVSGPIANSQRTQILELAVKSRLPVIYRGVYFPDL